jgi:hypothetical protein
MWPELIAAVLSAAQNKQNENNQTQIKPANLGEGLASNAPASSSGGGGGFMSALLGMMKPKKEEPTTKETTYTG